MSKPPVDHFDIFDFSLRFTLRKGFEGLLAREAALGGDGAIGTACLRENGGRVEGQCSARCEGMSRREYATPNRT